MTATDRDAVKAISRAYEQYFSSGLYDQRYPRPNCHSLEVILRSCGAARRILDFGCGDGRYTIPLLQRTGATVFAYDICAVALSSLQARAAAMPERQRLRLIQGPLDDYCDGEGLDIAIIMFGVLGHIPKRAERIATLERIRRSLAFGKPGRLILSVPNARRRFFAEQRRRNGKTLQGLAMEPGDITYSRQAGRETINLFYHLYTPAELVAELRDAGYTDITVQPESLLPEAAITQSGWLARLDRLLCPLLPSGLGYGIMATARGAP